MSGISEVKLTNSSGDEYDLIFNESMVLLPLVATFWLSSGNPTGLIIISKHLLQIEFF